jgi:hypothetical protein
MPERFAGRRLALTSSLLMLVTIATVVFLTSRTAGVAKAGTPSLYVAYPALNSTEPTGLPLIAPPSASSAAPTGPVFLASPPPGAAPESWPVAASIRKLPINLPIASAWIAQSVAGGICILDARHQPVNGHYGIGMSCSEPSRTDSGTYLESTRPGSNVVTIMGVVPSSVAAVQVTLTNGTTEKVPVNDNAWGLETEAHLQSVSNVEGG